MKIIHCSDLHLDSKMQTHLSSAKALERKKEILLTFERMVDYANKNQVSAIIIAGDMFDTARVSVSTKNRVLSLISKNKDISFFYLAGNHDEQNFIDQIENVPNLKVFGEKWTTFSLGEVDITGIKELSARAYDLLDLKSNRKNIVVLHGEILKYNSQKNAKETINLIKLAGKNIDYLALGHYHFYLDGKIDDRGTYCYSGCLEGRGFDECGERGFVLLNIENGKVEHQFVSFAKRKMVEVEVDISGINEFYEIEQRALKALKDVSNEDLVRVVLVGKYNLNLHKDLQIFEKKLCSRFYFGAVKDKSSLYINPKNYTNDLSLKGEFIRNVLASNLSEEDKESVILVGLKALDGEEVAQ